MNMKICPFKSQNMSNNAYATHNGFEISTAQAVQANAAKLIPEVFMNPILLKPRHNQSSEIILNGKVFANDTKNYRNFTQNQGINAIRNSLKIIRDRFDAIIIEGAGSPAEINLNAFEIVNMKIAREADVPVILVADVDRGGSLASVAGTLELLGNDRTRVKGIIYNKFRGNIELFKSAIDWTENYTGVKVLGVVPYIEDVKISGEDSLNIHANYNCSKNKISNSISIGIINYPGISNFSDFDKFSYEPDAELFYIDGNISIKDFHELDAIILPGTKNTFSALKWLHDSGLFAAIKNFSGYIFGICGGLQILGREIYDYDFRENDNLTETCGLSLLPLTTNFDCNEKITRQISDSSHEFSGYEIHFGRSNYFHDDDFILLEPEGIMRRDMRIAGTYIHGIFDSDEFRALWLNKIRRQKNYGERSVTDTSTVNNDSYDYIANILAKSLDINFILKLIRREDTTPQPELF